MSNTSNFLNLAHYLSEHEDDPAIKGFVPKLKDHLLSQLLSLDYDGDERVFTDVEQNSVCFINNLNMVSQAKHLQINYTTYDVHRDQDTLKPGYSGVVMTLSREHDDDTHPFWYAQVLGAFSIQVLHVGPDICNCSPQSMEFLWVWWFGVVPCYRWGIREGCLPKVGFILDSPSVFGFLDPSIVLRACHLIPCFADGHMDTLLQYSPTVVQLFGEVNDWAAFYVNM
ncbi:hypothetical protein BDR04DRAFT_1127678 [Suillus decipiens]|nr:hypothetical protein BDR04DRAFT_1127678 [Suillus decipiens]